MKTIAVALGALAVAALGFAGETGQAAQPTKPAAIRLTPGAAPASQALIDALAAKDQALFEAVFACKLDLLADLVADDFEFLHDKHGQTATSGSQFRKAVADGCEKQKDGTNFKARRELVPGTMNVYVLNNYGAFQMGAHRFYAIVPGQPDRLTETGKFIDVWKNDGGAWRLARVISYDHVLAEAPPAAK